MKHIFTLLIAVVALQLSAQVTITPATLEKTIPLNGDYVMHLKVKNDGSTPATVHWKLLKDAAIPTQWKVLMCDMNLCYGPTTIKNPANKPNEIPANTEVEFMLHIDPNGNAGSAKLSLQLFSDAANTNMLFETDVNGVVTASSSSATANTVKEEISVYPNPADNYFSLKNSSGISKLVLFNVVGREVKKFNSITNNFFDVSDLNKGIYLVRAVDVKGKTLKTVRLSIR